MPEQGQRVRKASIDSDTMERALQDMRREPEDAMPRNKDAAAAFQAGITKLIGRVPVQHCHMNDWGKSVPNWSYAAWLTAEEWLLIKMKWL